MSLWHVCVPGLTFDPETVPDDDGAKVICVNAALKGMGRCDYWGAYDAPGDLHGVALKEFRKLLPDIITDKSRVKMWVKWWETLKVPRDDWPSLHTPEYKHPLWFKKAAPSPFFTFFGVMGFAVQEGATEIQIHGCTLTGNRYFDEQASELPNVKRKVARCWKIRWARERVMLQNIINAGPTHGVTFTGVDVAILKG